eukprot:scaffold44358_cov36-Prasinocladus_malaysianus.AAC.1
MLACSCHACHALVVRFCTLGFGHLELVVILCCCIATPEATGAGVMIDAKDHAARIGANRDYLLHLLSDYGTALFRALALLPGIFGVQSKSENSNRTAWMTLSACF